MKGETLTGKGAIIWVLPGAREVLAYMYRSGGTCGDGSFRCGGFTGKVYSWTALCGGLYWIIGGTGEVADADGGEVGELGGNAGGSLEEVSSDCLCWLFNGLAGRVAVRLSYHSRGGSSNGAGQEGHQRSILALFVWQ